MKLKVCLSILAPLFFINSLLGQTPTTDSTRNINWDFIDSETTIDNNVHSPRKAALYSAVLPGLGQGYNKKYWKIPLIYGIGAFLGFKVYQNNRDYISYRNELFKRDLETNYTSISFSENEEFSSLSTSLIRTRKDIFQEDRDKFIVYSSLFYIANIVDALVDAHLTSFTKKNKKKQTISLRPSLNPNQTFVSTGLELKLRF